MSDENSLLFDLKSGRVELQYQESPYCCGIADASVCTIRVRQGFTEGDLYRDVYKLMTEPYRGKRRMFIEEVSYQIFLKQVSMYDSYGAFMFTVSYNSTKNRHDGGGSAVRAFVRANNLKPDSLFTNPNTGRLIGVYCVKNRGGMAYSKKTLTMNGFSEEE